MGFVGPIQAAGDPLKLRPSSYLVLGMVRLGARSGYAIKKLADTSTRVFFPISLAQVYPELARLQSGGFLVRTDDAHGRRNRSFYALTESGERALVAWLQSERIAPARSRDESLLRLFLADALPQEDEVAYVRRMRDRARDSQEWMRNAVFPAARALEAGGAHGPRTVARFGADLFEFVADWMDRYADELERRGKDT
jgi:PadR family transcriptional regulator AphA